MPPLPLEQRSAEWLAARRGRITASLAAACLGLDPHKGPLAAFNEITGRRVQKDNRHMRWGVEFEQQARTDYECETGNLVNSTGFWTHPDHDWLGASPDGLIGEDGLVEVKCPSILPCDVPPQHAIQMRVQLAVTDRAWCDYFAWNQNGHFLQRFERDAMAERYLLNTLGDFYLAYILPDVSPPRRRIKRKPVEA